MKFNLKGLNLNMLLLVAIFVGVVVVFMRQNNKCVMDEGVEGFGWRTSYKKWLAKIKKHQEQLERRIREANLKQRAVSTEPATITEPAEPCANCVCGTKCGNRHSPFATFRGVGVRGFTPIGTYTTKPLEQVLTDCDSINNCQGVIAYGNNKILMQNTDENTMLQVSNDNPNINSYIRWNTWMEQGRGYDTMMILPDGREREMNWDTFTTI